MLSAAEWEPLEEIEHMFKRFGYSYNMLGRLASRRDKRRVYRAYELRLKTSKRKAQIAFSDLGNANLVLA